MPPLTLTKLRLNAEQGDTDDQYNLGFPYANGERGDAGLRESGPTGLARQLNKETRALN